MATHYLTTIVKALATSMGARVFAMGLRFVTICLLPFWLAPSEIGWSAVIMALTNLVVAVSDFGFGTALIRESSVSRRMGQSVFVLVVGASVVMGIVMIVGAAGLEALFSVPAWLVMISAFAVPLSAMTILPNALLQRELRFTSLAVRDLVGEVSFSVTAVWLAVCGETMTCIAWALVVQRAVRWIASSVAVEWRPGFRIVWSYIRRLLSFSMFQLGNITITQLANRLDMFLLSVFMPPAVLGYYAQGQQLSTTPVQSLMGAATNVFFASFAKLQSDEARLRELFVKVMKGVIVCGFGAVGVMVPAMGLIPVVYDASWTPSVGIARILCLSIPFVAASAFEGLLITIGGERRRLFSSLLRTGIMAGGIWMLFGVCPTAGAWHVAWLVFVAFGVGVGVNMQYIFGRLRLTRSDVRVWIRPLMAGLAIAVTGILLTLLFF